MNINLKLNKVQEQMLKDIMKKQKRAFTLQETQKFMTDTINHLYIMGQ